MQFMEGADEWAFGHYQSYDWRRYIIRLEEVNFNLPFLRTVEGADHTLFVIDIDVFNVDDHFKKVKYATVVVKWVLDKFPEVQWLVKFSGSSFHLIQKYEKRINPNAFETVMKYIFKEWIDLAEEKPEQGTDATIPRYFVRQFACDGEAFEAGIDKSLTDRRHIISGVYSEYAKEEGFYSRPVTKEELDDPRALIEHSKFFNLTISDYDIPPFQFEKWLDHDIEIESQSEVHGLIQERVRDIGRRTANIPITLLPKTKENDLHLQAMKRLISSTDWLCVRRAVHRAKTEHGVFFERAPIARFLWWNYSKELNQSERLSLIAYYFYYEINNEDDNKPENWRRMEHGLNFALYNRRGEEKSMDTWHSENIIRNNLCDPICSAPCKKFLFDMSALEPIENFQSVIEPIRKIIQDGENTIIKKTTRVGVTSSTVLTALEEDKRILVVCPTNKIASETFYNISILAHQEGLIFSGAVIGSNARLCLKCMEEITRVRQNFISSHLIAIDKLPFMLREKCRQPNRQCEHFTHTFPDGVIHNENGVPTPILQSQLTPPYCAFSTIYNHIHRYNVVFMTYDKVRVLIHQLRSDRTTTEMEEIISDLLNNFEVILLDEVSRFINTPATQLSLFTKKRKLNEHFEETEEEEITQNILAKIRNIPNSERERWNMILIAKNKDPANNLVNQVMDAVDRIFINILGRYGENTWGRIKNPVPRYIRDEVAMRFNEWYSQFVDYAKQWNFHFPTLLRVMELVSQPAKHWYIVNIPKGREVSHVSIKIKPFYDNVIDFVRINHERGKQIIITDATMPFVSMNELFNIEFNDFNLGDPRNTCQLQLVIPDTRNIYPRDITRQSATNDVKNDMILFVNTICGSFGAENVMIVCQNRTVWRIMQHLYVQGRLPSEVNIAPESKQLTYYRSSATVGVANDRRIMVVIGSPFPPKHSYIWMAEMLKQRELFKDIPLQELSYHLWIRETSSAFFQTIGRCKDPFVREPSIVFCFGMGTYRINQLFNDLDVPKPHVININRRKLEDAVDIGRIWRRYRIFTEEFIYDTLKTIKEIDKPEIPFAELPQSLKRLSFVISRMPNEVLSYYGLQLDRKDQIIRHI
jgi:hypothetical protein